MQGSSMAANSSIPTPIYSDLRLNLRSFNPLFINFPPLKLSSRRNLSIKNAVSDQKLQDTVTDDQITGLENSFAPVPESVAASIKYHAEFTPSFSPAQFELPKAFFATAESVRDMLIINWNVTYELYQKSNAKQAYYLSMEFLQGRALLNAIGNLELSGAYAEALRKLGYNLEAVAEQEPDPTSCLPFFGFFGYTKLPCMGLWTQIQVWAV